MTVSAPQSTLHVEYNRPGIAVSDREAVSVFTRAVLGVSLIDLGWPSAELSVLYCSGAEIRRLNVQFRALDEETDVLSFPSEEDVKKLRHEPAPYLGDLAICPKYAKHHAAETGRALPDEVALLLIHGLLHLLGHDHETPSKERVMWAETDRLLALVKNVRRPAMDVS